MRYASGPASTTQYDIIGTIKIPVINWDENHRVIHITGKVGDIFTTDNLKEPPKIIQGRSAFIISLTSRRNNKESVVGTKVVLVKDIVKYSVALPDEDGVEDAMVNLQFEYTLFDMDYRNPDVPIIDPIISHIFCHGDWCCLFVEGNQSALDEYANSMRIFQHGGEIYHTHDIKKLIVRSTADENETMCMIIYGSTNVIADVEEINDSVDMFLKRTYDI